MLKIMSKAKYTALIEDKEKWQSEAGDLVSRNQGLLKKVGRLNVFLDDSVRINTLNVEKLEKSNAENEYLNNQLIEKEKVIDKLTEEVEKLKLRKSEIYRDLKKAEESLEGSETNLSHSRSSLNKSRTELTKLKSENKSLTIRNEGLNDALKDVSNGHSKLLKENQKLIQKNAKLQKFEDEVGSVLIEAISLIKSGGLKLPHNVNKALKLLQKHITPVVVESVVMKGVQPVIQITTPRPIMQDLATEVNADVKPKYKRRTPKQEKK